MSRNDESLPSAARAGAGGRPPHREHRGAPASAPAARDALGARGEELAVRHLEGVGFRVLDRNWRCAAGELDIVAMDGGALVICEVKTRSGLSFGSPLEAITTAKARRLQRLGLRWIAQHRVPFEELRFDVVGVLSPATGETAVQHVRGVI